MLEDTDEEEVEVAEGEVPPGDHLSWSRALCTYHPNIYLRQTVVPSRSGFRSLSNPTHLVIFCPFVLHVSSMCCHPS